MLRETLRQLSSPTINSGNRTFYDLSLGMRTLALVFRFSASVTIAGGPITAIRNAGSLLSQFLELGLNENGDDVVVRWKLQGAMPMKWTGPTLAGKGGGDVAIEELVLSVESVDQE